MLCAGIAHLSHSFGGLFRGVFEHYRDVIDPADPACGFGQKFQLASRVHYCYYYSIARMLGASPLVAL